MSSATESITETSAGGEQAVRTSRTIPAPVSRVWEHLISPGGTQALLGSGATLGSKGESWHSAEGPHGVVRSFHPLEQLRVSWHATEDAPATLVDLQLSPDDEGTRIDLAHEHLHDVGDLETRWTAALERFAAGLG